MYMPGRVVTLPGQKDIPSSPNLRHLMLPPKVTLIKGFCYSKNYQREVMGREGDYIILPGRMLSDRTTTTSFTEVP